jgi:hypothetical protein
MVEGCISAENLTVHTTCIHGRRGLNARKNKKTSCSGTIIDRSANLCLPSTATPFWNGGSGPPLQPPTPHINIDVNIDVAPPPTPPLTPLPKVVPHSSMPCVLTLQRCVSWFANESLEAHQTRMMDGRFHDMGGWESIPNFGIDLGIPFHPRDTEVSVFSSLFSSTTGGMLSDKDAMREYQKTTRHHGHPIPRYFPDASGIDLGSIWERGVSLVQGLPAQGGVGGRRKWVHALVDEGLLNCMRHSPGSQLPFYVPSSNPKASLTPSLSHTVAYMCRCGSPHQDPRCLTAWR